MEDDHSNPSTNTYHQFGYSAEGGLQIVVAHQENGKVFINFGKEIAWIGVNPLEALELAFTIIKHAYEAKK